METYSAIKKSKHEALAGKWIQLVIVLLGEMVWIHTVEHHIVSLV